MSRITQCKISDLADRLPQPLDCLFVSASFEERGYGIGEQLWENVRSKRFVCFNENHLSYLHSSVNRFREMIPNAEFVSLDSDNPLRSFNNLRLAIKSLTNDGACHVGIDITCFTREATPILLFLMKHELPKGSLITAFYQKAGHYGRTRRGGWLTEGVREVRTILGYSGSVSLSADTHLIIVSGFEYERAQEIVDAVQPTRISLGHAMVEDGVAFTFNLDHETFVKQLEGLYLGLSLDRFNFSSVDPFITKANLQKVVQTSCNQNIVVACLNTKPATFGVSLAALEDPVIQLVYAQPVCYNTLGYSEPSGEIVFFTINNL